MRCCRRAIATASVRFAAAKTLDEEPDARWLDVERRLPSYVKGPGGIQLFEGQPFVQSHRHHSHLAGLYPFDTVSLANEEDRQVVRDSYVTWVYKGTGEWSGWCVPWASILHAHLGEPAAAVHALKSWKTFFNNPGHGSLHDAFRRGFTVLTGNPAIMQMDGQCAAATAVLELLAHEIDGKTEFFRGCPAEWKDVSFENLALSDGRRVSGRRLNGKVTVSTAGSPGRVTEPQEGAVVAQMLPEQKAFFAQPLETKLEAIMSKEGHAKLEAMKQRCGRPQPIRIAWKLGAGVRKPA